MNRRGIRVIPKGEGVPHMRGDEPKENKGILDKVIEFPTCVGMNRLPAAPDLYVFRVPHMRGDEPAWMRG